MLSSGLTKPTSSFEQRLLAEALRRHEEASGAVIADPRAELAALGAGGDFEARICKRAQLLAERIGLLQALKDFERALRIALLIITAIGLLLGVGAAHSTLRPDHTGLVNFFWVLVALLGVHSVALLLWLVLSLIPSRLPPATPLRIPFQALVRMFMPAAARAESAGAVAHWANIFSSGALGRWGIGTLLHSFWLAALTGMLVVVLVLLSARQFDFVWETTILPDSAFIAASERLAYLPERLGLPMPDRETIGASRRADGSVPPAHARREWSALLIGSLIAYGILPRVCLLVLSTLLYRRARARYRLDVELPGYARLRSALMPPSKRIGVVDKHYGPITQPRQGVAARQLAISGPMAVLGIEIDDPHTGWPPNIAQQAQDLGIASDQNAIAAAQRALAGLQQRPIALLLVCSLAASPDRGMARALRALRTVHHGPLALLLTQSGKTFERLGGAAYEERVGDWQRIAQEAGIPATHVSLLDLDDVEAMRAWHMQREHAGQSNR